MKIKTGNVRDPMLYWLAVAASVIGLLFIFDAGYARSISANRGFIAREVVTQSLSLIVALVVSAWASRQAPETWLKWSKILWIVSLVLLLAVKLPGIGVTMNGASRWLKFPGIPFLFQPAEFAKLTTVLYLAGVLTNRKAWPKKIAARRDFKHWFFTVALPKADRALPLLWVGLGILLIEIEPDLGTAAVVAFTVGMLLFIGGVTKRSLWACGAICAMFLALVMVKQPYRMDRITTHGSRWQIENMDAIGFQTTQSETAMASGSLFGTGLGSGRAKHVLPAATTDFVMATVAEETGLFGSLIVLGVIGGLVMRLFKLAASVKDRFQGLVLSGVASWIGVQTAVNLMMANGFMPPIGIPVPFVSSGGSSLLALWLALGVCQSMLAPQKVKEETVAASDHRRRDRRAHLPGSRSGATVR